MAAVVSETTPSTKGLATNRWNQIWFTPPKGNVQRVHSLGLTEISRLTTLAALITSLSRLLATVGMCGRRTQIVGVGSGELMAAVSPAAAVVAVAMVVAMVAGVAVVVLGVAVVAVVVEAVAEINELDAYPPTLQAFAKGLPKNLSYIPGRATKRKCAHT
eukprot:COSAG01_NODE_10_length_42970_cov_93.010007_54_plen_160_part_00